MSLQEENRRPNLAGCRNVWVLAEHRDSKIRNITFELLGKGRELADTLEVELVAVLLGHNVGDQCLQLTSFGPDKVLWIDDPRLEHYQTSTYADVIVQQIRELTPEVFLIGATHVGRDLAPRIARRLGTGLTADCTGLEIDKEERLLVQTKPGFCGNLMASIVTPVHRPQMATVRPGVMKAKDGGKTRNCEIIRLSPEIDPKKTLIVKILETVKEGKKSENLEIAHTIVSGGMGVGKPGKFAMIEKLAEVLGGEVGATRDVVEAGWISSAQLIGQTGKTVRPRLYVACGISGAVQHVAGVKESDTIVAINSDPDAPIFQIADYGIVADLHQVIPLLIEEIKRVKEGS